MIITILQIIIADAFMIGFFEFKTWTIISIDILILIMNLSIWAWKYERNNKINIKQALNKIDELLNQEWTKRHECAVKDDGISLFLDDIKKGLPISAKEFIEKQYSKYYQGNETTWRKKETYFRIVYEYLNLLNPSKGTNKNA